jgi:hypothetical protein
MPNLTTLELRTCRFPSPGLLQLLLCSLGNLQELHLYSPSFADEQDHEERRNQFRWLNYEQSVAANRALSLKVLSIGFSRRTLCRHEPTLSLSKDPDSVNILDSVYRAIDVNRLSTLYLDLSGNKAHHIIRRLLDRCAWPSVKTLYLVDHDEVQSLPSFFDPEVPGKSTGPQKFTYSR